MSPLYILHIRWYASFSEIYVGQNNDWYVCRDFADFSGFLAHYFYPTVGCAANYRTILILEILLSEISTQPIAIHLLCSVIVSSYVIFWTKSGKNQCNQYQRIFIHLNNNGNRSRERYNDLVNRIIDFDTLLLP